MPDHVYYMDSVEDRLTLIELATEGGHTVLVAERQGANFLRLANLRHAPHRYGTLIGDAQVKMPTHTGAAHVD